jgi:hypothetical protein
VAASARQQDPNGGIRVDMIRDDMILATRVVFVIGFFWAPG